MVPSRVRTLVPFAKRTFVSKSNPSSLGAGATPPLPPFARIPVPSQKLIENNDAIFDDGVAPELALDFDCQHVDSTEGLLSWLGGIAFFTTVFQVIKSTDPESKNPAVNRRMNVVIDNPKTGPPTSD
mmetsp:Transcript_14199/g.20279  ORF Transcript_14199/g.20279 Transcript_14199/m.20279 type:complete len:127 (+) Transcript_14199:48-428(+)|eukprot:CAMPEP_0184862792 /NCGR_PEP_ID=MMETSP0580-20130426/7781_1 /TAXON_ID=1118495 /ORGANISM="Dactyliosolen fragilissimus" /LENGTH=126 /DNA_ID=CAMNT_0027360783 /DNA_START=48 /DNA_END=428 /DNA_ORIENTATION=-